jgi:hypothetical protein
MTNFYGKVLALKQITNEKGWRELAAGAANIALHSGPSSPVRKGPKIVFRAKDVAALRETFVAHNLRQSSPGRNLLSLRWQRSRRQPHPIIQSLTQIRTLNNTFSSSRNVGSVSVSDER